MNSTTQKIKFWHSLRGKLLLIFLGIALIPLAIAGTIAVMQARSALNNETDDKLVAVRDIKTSQISSYFSERIGDVKVFSSDPTIVAAMEDFHQAVNEMMQAQNISEADVMGQMRDSYLKQPNLNAAKDGSAYSTVHNKYHPFIKKYVEAYGYYDAFLVDAQTGDIVYTMYKEDDYGTNLKDGAYADTNIGSAFKETVIAGNSDFTMLEDFAYYPPSKGAASFVASPIFDDEGIIGVLIFQLPIDQINVIMQERSGMGESGETYLVGSDKLMRSDSRFSDESTIFKQKIDPDTANKALNGNSGIETTPDYRGVPVLSAYAPLPLQDVQWVILSEIDKAEAYAPAQRILISTLMVLAVAAILVVGVAFVLANNITNPILKLAIIGNKLSIGEIEQDIKFKRKDELGVLARAFTTLIEYMQDVADVAERMAGGDLSTNVTPRSDKDVLNTAFSNMVILLRKLLQEVNQTAAHVSAAATQLSAASEQSSMATEQVATTIQQIAQGTVEQNSGIVTTTHNLDQLGQAIEGVAQGAQEQAASAAKTAQITAQVNNIIHQVTESAQNGAASAASAIETAHKGSQTLDKSLSRMQSIQETVGFSAEKVQEMGERSAQIGAIIETIDDIAAQTNLLALNAAIEAARAGEHGKGFAVVADEVRKLAEKSANATKEISALIGNIQSTVEEAVKAMEKSAVEVTAGVADSDEAGMALKLITTAIGDVNQQVEDIAAAAEEMSANSNELLEAIETVSAVVQENTAATEEMSANSAEVMEALETMVSVSEENSAAVEEVSASVEEVSAQSEEVSASADELNEMAESLTALVTQFKLASAQGISQQIELYKQAHMRWVDRLHKMLVGRLKLDAAKLGDHTTCILGQWYYERGQAEYGEVQSFIAVEDSHIRIHKMVKEAVSAFNRGDIDTARRHTTEVEDLSHQVVEALNKLENYIDKNIA